MKTKFKFKRIVTLVIAVMMLVTAMPVGLLAKDEPVNYENSKIVNNKVPVKVAKTDNAEEFIKNPAQPAIYTLRTDYKVQRGEKYDVDYQPYIASVGEAATQVEKDKVKKTIDLPDLAGYDEPQENFTINYDTVKNAADGKGQTGNATNGIRYQANEDFRYKAKANQITIKHVFQDLEDFTKYTNPDGSVGETGEIITTQNGNTGSTMEVSPLTENDPRRKGFVPEADSITMQVPENAENFILEYRYSRAHYDVTFDTAGGTALPARTLYYGQVIPKIADEAIPKKEGGEFLGWKPSVELTTKDGKTYKANEIIAVGTNEAIKNLDANLIMPPSKLTFTAVWKDKEKADYAVQFWAEKADHADGASLLDKYDYIGTRVYKDKDTGMRPDLDNEPVKDIVFPDLDKARLNKIWAGARFNRTKNLYLNKFYVYNQALTHEENKDTENVNLVKSVDSTGKTVYNIYYDRQVYDLYFTKSNAQPEENTFYPEIWQYDEAQGEAVMKGGPGNLYHYKARFNEMMYKWPNDAKQTKGFTPGYQSFGWGPNYTVPNWPLYLDTPPYRLNADEFLDMANYINWGGYTKHIDKGDGKTIDLDPLDFKTLSFGIKQDHPSIPHHMDFWMDGFKKGETIIRYDLVRTKADTAAPDYGHRYPRVQGFTPHNYDPNDPQSRWPSIAEGSEENGRVNEDEINDLNDEREAITPNNCGTYYNNQGVKLPIGQLGFIPSFFSDSDEFGDVKEGGQSFEENGYLQFHYKRNKYPLRFNYDPSITRDDSYFNSKNQIDTFYEFPLKCLSPDLVDDNIPQADREYFKEDPRNLLDNPENLKQLELTELVFNDANDNNKLKVKRPGNVSDQMVFKGWALDPAGSKLIWENPGEKMPNHPVNLYAKWGEPDYKWKVTFDPNGGSLRNIKEDNLTTSRKKIQEGDIGQEEINIYAKKEANDGDKQVFTVIQRQKLVEPKYKPTKKGHDFMGWEVIRYKKDAKTGDYTDEIDTSYRDTYKVPELYSFGNDVVSPIYLKAIWVPNDRVDVKVEHHILSLDLSEEKEMRPETLYGKRANYLVATTGDQQDDEYILATHKELSEKLTGDLKKLYEEYNGRVKANNTFFQQFRVEPEKKLNQETNQVEDNPDVKDNIFHFFYKPFRTREYKVNYIDERFKDDPEKGKIIDQELVTNGNRHFDARNYRPIPGWKLVSAPQQQLFFDVNEKTNEFLGINGTGKDEITFYYKDVRVIEVSNKNDPVPDGYVRVTFKADKGGSFGKDAEGKDITELNYDVIKGLQSQLLPVPKELSEGETVDKDKHYITPETGKKFTKWDKNPLLNDNTIINEAHEFTAYFEWSGLSASGLVRTEAFKDPSGKWTNDFAPTIDQLKKQLVWREKDQVKDLPAGTEIKLFDEAGNELTKDEQVYDLVSEKKTADKDELVRTVNVKAKVTFKDGKEPQELIIPITVYKNVYEALNEKGEKPLFLSEAEKKEAKDGGLSDVTGNYVKVTVQPTEKNTNKDAKVYYVNPKAWVNIPEVAWSDVDKDKYDFLKWTADKDAQNENGVFDFSKRHKFTDEETLIKPIFTNDVVEQKEGEDKPKVPDNFVKVIVKTTDKATDETAFEKTFWVNPTKEVAIPVTNPTGKENQKVTIDGLGEKTVNYIFKEWQKVQTGADDNSLTKVDPAVKIDLSKNQYTDKVTVIEAAYKKSIQAEPIVKPLKTTKLDTPQGKEITNDALIKQITPQEGKEIKSIEVVTRPDPSKLGEQKAEVIVTYTDGTTQGTKEKPVVIPVEVHKNIIPEAPGGQRPKDALENYVKVIFKAGTGGSLSGDLVYYVSPEVEVDMKESAKAVTKTPDVGYFVNGEKWTNKDKKILKGTFTDPETEFVFTFDKSKDIVEKTDDPKQEIPKGYVKVTFKTEDEKKGKLEGNVKEKIYYVNPKAGITLKVLGKNETATDKQLAVPKTIPAEHYEDDTWYEEIDQKTPITSERIHVAKFKLAKVTLTYEAGEGTGTVPAAVEVDHGTTVALASADGLTKENATFAGWKLDGEEKIYKAGEQVTLEKARTATAQWTTAKHKVTFNSMGGSDVPSQTVDYGKTATNPEAPKLDGKVFMGWKEKETDTSYFDFNTPITADKTLIAIWQDSVQKINDGDTVEEQFIKVTFNEGKHGKFTDQTSPVTYKVAKEYKMAQAIDNGLVVPKAIAKTYYKLKDVNNGWNQALELNGKDITFTAQYEPIADVIPIDPAVTPDEKLQEDKPEGMVLVTFKVSDDNTFYIPNNAKYYVKKETEVRVPTPVVLEKNNDAVFNGWKDVNIVNEPIDPNTTDPDAKKFQWVKQAFKEDTVISDNKTDEIKLIITKPFAGDQRIYIEQMSADSTGKLELIRAGNVIETVTNKKFTRRRKEYNVFDLTNALQSGDTIRYWQESSSRISDKTTEVIN